jgi:hypothetical protein
MRSFFLEALSQPNTGATTVLVNEPTRMMLMAAAINWVRFEINAGEVFFHTSFQARPFNNSSTLPLPLSQSEANASCLIVVDKQHSCTFKRCLNSHDRRNVTLYRSIAFLNALDGGGSDARSF